jgi:hypothetical protein
MEKVNTTKMKYIILFLLTSCCVFSQNKTIVPKTGTIVFVKEEIVMDKDLYLKSWKESIPKVKKAMEKQLVYERLIEGKKTDTILLKKEVDKISQAYEMMLPMIVDEPKENIKFHHEFKGDTIIAYNSKDNISNYNQKLINQISGSITNENNDNVKIHENQIIKLTEFKKETKIINGLKCFKVVYSFNHGDQESTFDFFSEVVTNIRELWVTQEIKCNYHPVINEKEILEKYYPLEILEYSNEIKGFKTTYTIEKFSLI